MQCASFCPRFLCFPRARQTNPPRWVRGFPDQARVNLLAVSSLLEYPPVFPEYSRQLHRAQNKLCSSPICSQLNFSSSCILWESNQVSHFLEYSLSPWIRRWSRVQVQNIRYRVGCYVSGYIMRSMPAYPGTESWVDCVMCIGDCLVRLWCIVVPSVLNTCTSSSTFHVQVAMYGCTRCVEYLHIQLALMSSTASPASVLCAINIITGASSLEDQQQLGF